MANAADDRERSRGIGKKELRRMKKRWKEEGSGLSLKEWAKNGQVGDAQAAWIEAKRGSGRERA
jgi:hypothetical protein